MSKEESINNLKTYIEEDVIYQENNPKSDFDEFCIGHCRDIETVLNYIKELERENGYLRVIKNENEYYTENINLVTERMIKCIEKNVYKIEISKGNFVDIKELYTKYKELEEKIKLCEDTGTKLINKKTFTDNFINKQVIRDKIEELKNDKRFYECFPEDYMAEICINILKELLESEE